MSDDRAADEESGQDPQAITQTDLVEWVEHIVSRLESVDRSGGQHWCSQWWNHSEAVDRLRALYERWLEAQADGAMSSWWVDHFDSHATILFAKRGPFGECGTLHTEKTSRRILATERPPEGWTW
jgi:hypothetical protein